MLINIVGFWVLQGVRVAHRTRMQRSNLKNMIQMVLDTLNFIVKLYRSLKFVVKLYRSLELEHAT